MSEADGGWNDAPTVLIFADRAEQRREAEEAALSAQVRVIGVEPIAHALNRLSRQVKVDAVLIELDEDVAPHTRDRLLDWANHAARNGETSAIVSLPTSLIDAVVARIDAPRVQLLCDPKVADRAVQLGFLLSEQKQRLHDQGQEADAERLRRLSEEVARIATTLAELSTTAKSVAYQPARDFPQNTGESGLDAERVRGLIRVRRLREQFFPSGLFADPAWDMLLDLMAARLEKSRVAVSSLCIAAAVPATTALRWIRTLTENGLLVRREDPGDGRRVFIELADSTAEALSAYFNTALQMGLRLPES